MDKEGEKSSIRDRGNVAVWLGFSIILDITIAGINSLISENWNFLFAAFVLFLLIVVIPILIKGYLGEWESSVIKFLKRWKEGKIFNGIVMFMRLIVFMDIAYHLYIIFFK